ncbi:MAG: hypothetical protein MUC46_10095 [Desulfobacterales bacterium]|nr:hypothetical protein [Desulfobacterales bacterium]
MAADPACPICGSLSFFVKDPADEYETHEFTLVDGQAVCADPARGRPGGQGGGRELLQPLLVARADPGGPGKLSLPGRSRVE